MKKSIQRLKGQKGRTGRKLLLISIPFLLFVTAFSYVPLLGWSISFFRYYPGIPLNKLEFMGLKNFQLFFSNKDQVLLVLRNTFVLSGLILVTLPLPAVFAIFLNEIRGKWFKKTVQTFSTIPYFISYVLIYLAFVTLFSPSDGMINTLLVQKLHILKTPLNILNNDKIAWTVQTLTYLFKNLGYSAILYLSAIAGIDTQLYEAAEVDGCNRFKQAIYITLPSIKTTIILVLLLGMGSLVTSNFEQVYGLQNVYTQNETEVINTLVYRKGIQGGEYSLATAFGLMQGIVSVTLVIIANKFSQAVSETSLW